MKDEAPDWLKGRKIGDAIADLEKKLHEKHGSNWPDLPPKNGSPSAAQGTARGAASPSIAGRVAAANKAGAAPSGEKGLEDAKKRVEAEIGMSHFFPSLHPPSPVLSLFPSSPSILFMYAQIWFVRGSTHPSKPACTTQVMRYASCALLRSAVTHNV